MFKVMKCGGNDHNARNIEKCCSCMSSAGEVLTYNVSFISSISLYDFLELNLTENLWTLWCGGEVWSPSLNWKR